MKRKMIAGLLLAAVLGLSACGTEELKEVQLFNTQGERVSVVIDVSNPQELPTEVETEEEDLSYDEEETEEETETETETEEETETETETEEIAGAIPAGSNEKETEKNTEKSTEKSTENKTDTSAFTGRWQDDVNPQTVMDITSTGTNTFHAFITRAETENQTYRWEFDGTYSEALDRLDYTVCTKMQILKYTDGTEETSIVYPDGTGYMQIQSTGKLYWTDNKENAGANREFSKL